MGYRPTPRQQIFHRRVLFPVKSSSGQWIWPGSWYYRIETYYDNNGKPPVKGSCWTIILTEAEWTLEQLKKL